MKLIKDVETLERKKLMREELLDQYGAAICNPSKETVGAYREAQTRIGPVVAVSEILKVEELKEFIKNIEWSGNEDNTRCPKCGAFQWNGHEEWCDFPRMINL